MYLKYSNCDWLYPSLVGVTYDDGLLKILHNGTHEINSPTHVVHRFLSTQEKSIRLATLSAKQKQNMMTRKKSKNLKATDIFGKGGDDHFFSDDVDSDLTICETKGKYPDLMVFLLFFPVAS